jgi:hypothetical protein
MTSLVKNDSALAVAPRRPEDGSWISMAAALAIVQTTIGAGASPGFRNSMFLNAMRSGEVRSGSGRVHFQLDGSVALSEKGKGERHADYWQNAVIEDARVVHRFPEDNDAQFRQINKITTLNVVVNREDLEDWLRRTSKKTLTSSQALVQPATSASQRNAGTAPKITNLEFSIYQIVLKGQIPAQNVSWATFYHAVRTFHDPGFKPTKDKKASKGFSDKNISRAVQQLRLSDPNFASKWPGALVNEK